VPIVKRFRKRGPHSDSSPPVPTMAYSRSGGHGHNAMPVREDWRSGPQDVIKNNPSSDLLPWTRWARRRKSRSVSPSTAQSETFRGLGLRVVRERRRSRIPPARKESVRSVRSSLASYSYLPTAERRPRPPKRLRRIRRGLKIVKGIVVAGRVQLGSTILPCDNQCIITCPLLRPRQTAGTQDGAFRQSAPAPAGVVRRQFRSAAL
jgi:hypothetical protein